MKRDWLTLAFGLLLVAVVVALTVRQNMMNAPADASRTTTSEASVTVPSPASREAAPVTEAPTPAAAPAPVVTRPPEGTAGSVRSKPPRPASPPGPPRPTSEPVAAASSDSAVALQVQSDVAGASVFVDRQFVGTTPLNLRGLTTGPKQLNVTATGHEGYSSTIELTEGVNRVNVEFMKVRLNATIPVVHRHAMGSCQGMLTASAKGLVYETAAKDDAFTMALTEIEAFDVDYLKKNLRVRRTGGRTWNFTNNNSDALFVFHRDVSKAREKLTSR